MATDIQVSAQSVSDIFRDAKKQLFVIPEYQRPYAWSLDEVDTLFDDLWEFTESRGQHDKYATYFLGSIVSYVNDDGEQEIIDGQQRITTLFLLLRAIYTRLKTIQDDQRAQNFIRKIASALWPEDKLDGSVKFDETLLVSRVVNDSGNALLLNILKTGEASCDAKDNYSQNYRRFQQRFDEAQKVNPFLIYHFIAAILDQAILLPIKANSQDTALTIFSTLNDRGKPLSDADIFKATIYNRLDSDEKTAFIQRWRDLTEKSESVQLSVQQLFYYYMFVLRAQENDKKSTVPGVRKYFLEEKARRLLNDKVLDDIESLLTFWQIANLHDAPDSDEWGNDPQIASILDTLSSYPNEFWKYPVMIYYLTHRLAPDFARNFLMFLRALCAELTFRYMMTPTINAVKADIMKLNVEIISTQKPVIDFKGDDYETIKAKMKNPSRNYVRMLLKLLAYDKQDELLPDNWEVEHIFPQRWQDNYFVNNNRDEILEKIEHIGNKLPFEKKLNIVAGNGYYAKKKDFYKKSFIGLTRERGNAAKDEWGLDDIAEYDIRQTDKIMEILNGWKSAYKQSVEQTPGPSPEEQALIAKFRERGWLN